MTERDCLIFLSSVPDISSRRLYWLTDFFGSAKSVYEADISDYPAGDRNFAKSIISTKKRGLFEKTVHKMEQLGISYVSVFDDTFPNQLRGIENPPFALFYSGNLLSDIPLLAIVGSRRYTEYGKTCADKLSRKMAPANIGVVSGMARGIDTFAHKAVLEAGGYTIAVLGSGVDICYPPENAPLKQRIQKCGCVLSEYPPGAPPDKFRFPERNRIVSGLSRAVLVIEAEEKSGTGITIKCAISQNRNIFTVSRSGLCPDSKSDWLIKGGAVPITCSDDIIREFKKYKI